MCSQPSHGFTPGTGSSVVLAGSESSPLPSGRNSILGSFDAAPGEAAECNCSGSCPSCTANWDSSMLQVFRRHSALYAEAFVIVFVAEYVIAGIKMRNHDGLQAWTI